ncbi:MAG: S8 family serine peptidase [Pseudomonadota bacterium]
MPYMWLKKPIAFLPSITPFKSFASITGLDPAADWLLGTAQADFFAFSVGFNNQKDPPIPVLIELTDSRAVAAFNDLIANKDGISRLEPRPATTAPDVGEQFVALAETDFFLKLRAAAKIWFPINPETRRLKAFARAKKVIKISAPLRSVSWDPNVPSLIDPPVVTSGGDAIITAIIDDGIAIAHERFREQSATPGDPPTTRIAYFWHMGLKPPSAPTVRYGREFWKEDANSTFPHDQSIDRLLQDANGGDERVYRKAGIIDHGEDQRDPLAIRLAHGAHVMDTAAGADPKSAPRNRPIIAVQLPQDVVEDSSGARLDAHLAAALEYIVARAEVVAPGRPVVINLSYGYTAGPHNGKMLIERHMDNVVSSSGNQVQIVLSAGNAHLSRCYAEPKYVPSQSTDTLTWTLMPDDRTQSEVQIWLPNNATANDFSLTIDDALSSPTWIGHGGGGKTLKFGDTGCFCMPSELVLLRWQKKWSFPKTVATVRWFTDPESGRSGFSVRVLPTARSVFDGSAQRPLIVPHGEWKLTLNASREVGTAQAWIQRDESVYGYPMRGRQSQFDDLAFPLTDIDANYELTMVPPDVPIKRKNLVSAIATGRCTIVAGGYERASFGVLPYSAHGDADGYKAWPDPPNYDDRRPDVLMPSSDSFVHAGQLAAGSRSGACVVIGGTSVAAPQLTRFMVENYGSWLAGWSRSELNRFHASMSEHNISTRYPNARDNGVRNGYGRLVSPSRGRKVKSQV